ncbi:CDP-diacylglycerol--glycerol-3-phosphate 3-phosphatidyltransferase [Dermatophilus congolensis]|uniref:CDP-diacylglycerol--glycerol-3-phosphate 3-phosphatidyltransferase n=1 Tax=Dermatophilus congolensis TaxID=1863 RepID=UPI001AAF107C|nr:CDP-diacylglycerol--glycerol-3-phosphate 3-phosphatidyltransferase [Dermatophilus congolensis]MBO3129205.1 CDP-diacylglycerol--glycerol-3-phosphate 3-phosphatidyltransferase [Dermatophilus congolensis]MBO3132162.1 CDP-diacylglycerol--glycerol-3-phosphate 3-phosphatidyltransferase [Dermatophilus congolensis]MBO3133682.1 CDP-diacylglycerol--glycerol-3-phosphate 3-phosphatidyltransferase [Dermatophilus congolensis]MBO3135915.1 CDP-diacylglycerol--glycerol-3-phosphate 3-phosphatidyltransferase [
MTSSAPQTQPSSWNVPNALTVLRIFMVPLFGWLLLAGGGHEVSMRWWALLVFLLAMATDSLDGYIARSRNLVTNFGKIADPIADKVLTGMAFIGLSVIGDLWWWVTILILLREWGITVLRLVVIRYGVMPASRGGKIKTVLQTVALALLVAPVTGVLWWIGVVVVAGALVVTVATGVEYVFQAVRLVRSSSRQVSA